MKCLKFSIKNNAVCLSAQKQFSTIYSAMDQVFASASITYIECQEAETQIEMRFQFVTPRWDKNFCRRQKYNVPLGQRT